MTYTWVNNSFDTTGSGQIFALPTLDIAIPANAKLRKFLVTNTHFHGYQAGMGGQALASWSLSQKVALTTGPYGVRTLRRRASGVPMTVACYYDALLNQSHFQGYTWGGDNEFGIEESCNYTNGAGGTMNVEYTSFVFSETPAASYGASYSVASTLWVLYQS